MDILGYFHVLYFINNAAMNFGVHVSSQIIAFSGYMPRSRIAESYAGSVFFFSFKGPPYYILAIPIYIATNRIGGFPFLHTHSSI